MALPTAHWVSAASILQKSLKLWKLRQALPRKQDRVRKQGQLAEYVPAAPQEKQAFASQGEVAPVFLP